MVNFNSPLAKTETVSSSGFVSSYGVNTLTMIDFKVPTLGQPRGRPLQV